MDLRADCQQEWIVSLLFVPVFTFLLPAIIGYSLQSFLHFYLSIMSVCSSLMCLHLSFISPSLFCVCFLIVSLLPVWFLSPSPSRPLSPARIICSAFFWALTGYRIVWYHILGSYYSRAPLNIFMKKSAVLLLFLPHAHKLGAHAVNRDTVCINTHPHTPQDTTLLWLHWEKINIFRAICTLISVFSQGSTI